MSNPTRLHPAHCESVPIEILVKRSVAQCWETFGWYLVPPPSMLCRTQSAEQPARMLIPKRNLCNKMSAFMAGRTACTATASYSLVSVDSNARETTQHIGARSTPQHPIPVFPQKQEAFGLGCTPSCLLAQSKPIGFGSVLISGLAPDVQTCVSITWSASICFSTPFSGG